MFLDIWNTISSSFSGDSAKEFVEGIWQSDKRTDYKAFLETAHWIREQMIAIGLSDVQFIEHQQDGQSCVGDYVLPQGWDIEQAVLKLNLPNGDCEEIANYADNPCAIAMYSAPTVSDGVDATIVDFNAISKNGEIGDQVTNKIVLCSEFNNDINERLHKAGALGYILDMPSQQWKPGRRKEAEDFTYWANGYFIPQNRFNDFAFIVSPSTGDRIRALIQTHGDAVRAHALVQSTLYNAAVPAITAVIPGADKDAGELLSSSHTYEVGANDNASGAGTQLAIAACLTDLIKRGVLPQPKRSIRFVLGMEMYAVMAYMESINRDSSKIISGINLDMIGEDPSLHGGSIGLYHSTVYNPHFINDLTAHYMELSNATFTDHWQEHQQAGWIGDDYLSDPMINVPMCCFFHEKDRFYHSNHDTIEKVNPESLQRIGAVAASALYTIADAGLQAAYRIGDVIIERSRKRFDELVQQAPKHTRSIIDEKIRVERGYLSSLRSLVNNGWDARQIAYYYESALLDLIDDYEGIGEAARPLSDAEINACEMYKGKVPRRIFYGPIESWVLSFKDRAFLKTFNRQFPRLDINAMLFCIDGKRSVLESWSIFQERNEHISLQIFLDAVASLLEHEKITLEDDVRIDPAQLLSDLKSLGIKPGDVLMVHSSLKSIGPVDGGAEAIIDVMLEAVGAEGTVIMPTLTRTYVGNSLSSCGLAFDKQRTPSRVGALSDAFWRRKEAFRSGHPTHSLAAIGADAEEMMRDFEGASTFDNNGPYGNYIRKNAKVLFVGTGQVCNTTLHVVEDVLKLPYMERAKVHVMSDGEQLEQEVTMCPAGDREFYKKGARIERVFADAGVVANGSFGNAAVELIHAQDIMYYCMRAMCDEDVGILLHTHNDSVFCNEAREKLAVESDRIKSDAKSYMEQLKAITVKS